MAQFFATVVFVIDADDLEEAKESAEQLASTPDCPAFVDKAWVEEVEEANEEETDGGDDT